MADYKGPLTFDELQKAVEAIKQNYKATTYYTALRIDYDVREYINKCNLEAIKRRGKNDIAKAWKIEEIKETKEPIAADHFKDEEEDGLSF